jgi:hypothetical protein
VNLKYAFVGAAIIGDHQPQFRIKIGVENLGERERVTRRDLEVQFVPALDADIANVFVKIFGQRGLKLSKFCHSEAPFRGVKVSQHFD